MGVLLDLALRAGRGLTDESRAQVGTANSPGSVPAVSSPASVLHGRAAKLADLRRLIFDLAAAEPEHWTFRDIAEALTEGERDLDNALMTWSAILERMHHGRTLH